MEPVVKKLLLILIPGAASLLGIFVSLCGIGLSLGMRRLSLISFFSAVGLLVVLRLGASLWKRNKPNSKS